MTRQFTKQAAAIFATCGLAASVTLAQNEVEPNETKATATAITLPAGGGAAAIVGVTTGASTTAGATSLDQFLLTVPSTTLGIYRHNLTITTAGTAGHTGTIRGLNQTNPGAGLPGVAGTTDTTVQTSSTSTTPTRSNVWYGFGKNEQLYYRVTGGTTTTANYSVNYSVTPVTPIAGPSSIVEGAVTISTIGQTTVDTDFWLYDSNLNAVPLAGCDDESVAGGGTGVTAQGIITRTLTPGTYYLAMSRFNFANNQVSPADDDFKTGAIMDFPNVAVSSSSTTTAADFDVSIGGTPVTVLGAATTGFDVQWVQFTVIPASGPTPPTGSASSSPTSVNNCGASTALLTVAVTPGNNPVSTGITVTGDLTNIGGSSTQAFVDNGTGGDAVAGDNIFSYTATVPNTVTVGSKTLSYAIADAQGRTSATSGNVTITACPAANDECANAISLPPASGNYPFSTAGASLSTGFTYCAGTGGDVFYTWTAPASGTTTIDTCGANGDTVLAVYSSCAGGASIACNDDAAGTAPCAGSLQSFVSFTATQGTVYVIAVRNWSGANPVITGNINIVAPTGIDGTATATPASVFVSDPLPGGATVSNLAVQVFPATTPPSTGITVVGDLSSAGGSATQAFSTAGGDLYTFAFDPTVTGSFTFPIVISDAEGRTKNTTVSVTVNNGVISLGNIDTTNDGLLVDDVAVGAGEVRWFSFTTCNEVSDVETEWFDIHTNGAGLADTELGLYRADGTLVSNDDDSALGLKSLLTFGAGSGLLIGDTGELSDGFNGAVLPAGTYYLAAGDFNMVFGATGFAVTTGTDAGTIDITFDTNLSCVTLPTCGSIDFNGDGLFPDDSDLVDFLNVLAGGECSTGTCETIDFNRDGLFPDDNDLVDFLTVLAGGTPTNCTP